MFEDDDFANVALDPHMPIVSSSLQESTKAMHSGLYREAFLMIGVVVDVYPPSHKLNRSKEQYEYLVSAPGKMNTYKPIHCVMFDLFGGQNDYYYFTLKRGQRVQIQCLLGNTESGVITNCVRNQSSSVPESLGHHLKTRFNKITESTTSSSERYIRHDSGTEIFLDANKTTLKTANGMTVSIDQSTGKVLLSDAGSEVIELDKNNAEIKINAAKFTVNITGNASIKVGGDCKIDAKSVELNGSRSGVVTGGPFGTHPRDFITGAPILCVLDVKAGK